MTIRSEVVPRKLDTMLICVPLRDPFSKVNTEAIFGTIFFMYGLKFAEISKHFNLSNPVEHKF